MGGGRDRGPTFTMLDKITEEIAHFVGFLHMSVEDARMREGYREFSYETSSKHLDTPPVHLTDFSAPYEFVGFDPGLRYHSPPPDLWPAHGKPGRVDGISANNNDSVDPVQAVIHPTAPAGTVFTPSLTNFVPPELDPPGSLANHFSQGIVLSDNDYASVGGHGLIFNPAPIDSDDVLEAAHEVVAHSPLGDLDRPGTTEEIISVVETVIDQLNGATGVGEHVQQFIRNDTIDGIYVNGELVEEAPDIAAHYSFDENEVENASASNTWISSDGSVGIDVSVEIEAGGNTLVNNAVLKSMWTGGTVTAVVGDHIEVNAVIQTNAIWDLDAVAPSAQQWLQDGENKLFNIATFERIDAADEEASASGQFPSFWSVAEIKGDLMIVNWLEQFTFMSDNDIGIFSASRSTSSIVTGDNFGMNHVSAFELGFAYDLIIVGGSVYDGNIINQTNILFDNDVVGATGSFQTTGEATISSSGNLLWNQASIVNIGGADRFDSLPQCYLDAANAFADDKAELSRDVLSDDAFAGLQGVRVLYISGDLLSLNYIRQTNILGDSDQIALAMDAIASQLGANWSVLTGSNALLNNASILDLDSLGKTYVGGEQYSQETLYQAEFISQHPDFGFPGAGALVNEAVLFLDDTMLTPAGHAAELAGCIPAEYDGHANDGVNGMIGY